MYFHLLLQTGMRKSEALGLKWNCINFNEHKIHIKKQTTVKNGVLVDRDLKTASSKRRVHMNSSLMNQLKDLYDVRSIYAGFSQDDYVFLTDEGTLLARETIRRRMESAIIQSGVPKISVHGLRHTNISILMNQGIGVATVQKRVGHSKPDITLNTYTHSNEEDDKKAAKVMEDLF